MVQIQNNFKELLLLRLSTKIAQMARSAEIRATRALDK